VVRSTLDHSKRIEVVRVAVRKLNVALPGPLSYAEVVVERRADG
jgi:dihydroneopterin aldolase